MKSQNIMCSDEASLKKTDEPYYLVGLLSAFHNRFQAVADKAVEEISWKQFFAIICISLCEEAPTIVELAKIMGSSHQNIKQILLKLEKKGFVKLVVDENDKRRQRIQLTEYCQGFCEEQSEVSTRFMKKLFRGISEEQLRITIQTILQMEQNMMSE